MRNFTDQKLFIIAVMSEKGYSTKTQFHERTNKKTTAGSKASYEVTTKLSMSQLKKHKELLVKQYDCIESDIEMEIEPKDPSSLDYLEYMDANYYLKLRTPTYAADGVTVVGDQLNGSRKRIFTVPLKISDKMKEQLLKQRPDIGKQIVVEEESGHSSLAYK
jgi:hypothetical protein